MTFGSHAPTFASEPLKHRLRLSSSLPTLHRTWNAFEIDPDQDDTLTVEEMEALSVAAQHRPKRNTLDGIHVPRELQDRAPGGESPPPPRSPASEPGDTRSVHPPPLCSLGSNTADSRSIHPPPCSPGFDTGDTRSVHTDGDSSLLLECSS